MLHKALQMSALLVLGTFKLSVVLEPSELPLLPIRSNPAGLPPTTVERDVEATEMTAALPTGARVQCLVRAPAVGSVTSSPHSLSELGPSLL